MTTPIPARRPLQTFALAIAAVVFCCLPAARAATAFVETFEDTSGFTTSVPPFADTFGDYFGISDGMGGGGFGGAAAPAGLKNYTGFSSSFLTGMDLDGEGASLPIELNWTGIDITGLSNLEFSGEFAEFFDAPGDIDAADFIRISYQIDGGGYQNLLWFSGADFTSSGGPFNGFFRQDTDFDGAGDGTLLGDIAAQFTAAIAGTGSVLDLRMEVSLNSGDEDFAVDNFMIAEANGAPVCISAIPISEVQGPGDATPFDGQEVTVRGVVTADFGSEIVVQEAGGGPRSGVVVFASGNSASRGDDVCVTGVASERFGQTQVGGNSFPNAAIEILGAAAGPGAAVVATGDIATGAPNAEQWEAVLVRTENVTVANPDLGFGEFWIDDGSGAVRVDDKGSFSYAAVGGQALDFVQGPLFYTFNNYKIEPRDDDDIGAPDVPPGGFCGDPTTLISALQGSGAATPLAGEFVSVEAIVVGDFQANDGVPGDLGGFYLQEENADSDGDPLTSEGIFVFDLLLNPEVDVAPGDQLRVSGIVGEFQDQTQINAASGSVQVCATGLGNAVTPTTITFPLAGGQESLEALEGMSVVIDQSMTVIEYFNLDRFGAVDVALERIEQPTDAAAPGADAAAVSAANETLRIRLDDGSQEQNPFPVTLPDGQLDYEDAIGGGDTLSDIQGVMSWIRPRVGGNPERYQVQLTSLPTFTDSNARPPAPFIDGSVKAASFNVLNYFTTLGSRGADTPEELERQTAKIVAALAEIDADILGLIEIENNYADGAFSATAALVDALNTAVGAGTYGYIDPGANVGTDQIAVAIVYKPASVSPVGDLAILDSSVDPGFRDDRNRPALIQSFDYPASGERFTVAVNHLKSKGSPCDSDGDPNTGDGQGNCNGIRTAAATALADYLETDPTGSGDPDFLILGDLNAYAKEDPIIALTDAGFVDLLAAFNGDEVYSYVFNGETGYLDYALASASMIGQVSDAAPWNVNSDEPDAFDYNEDFDDLNNIPLWYRPTPYRSSDHDPVIVGLDLEDEAAPVVSCNAPDAIAPWQRNLSFTATAEDDKDPAPAVEVGDVECERAGGRWWKKWRKPPACRVTAEGDTVTIERTGMAFGRISWTATATDQAGNVGTEHCSVKVTPFAGW